MSALPTEQNPTIILVKRIMAGLVAFASVGVITFPEHTIAYKACFGLVGLGAALGITSTGVAPKA